MVLSRLRSGLFRAIFAMKEIENGKEIHRRVSAWCGAHGDDEWLNAASTFIRFRGWAFDAEQMGSTASTRWPDVRTAWRRWKGKHEASQGSPSATRGEGSVKKGGELLCRPKPVRFRTYQFGRLAQLRKMFRSRPSYHQAGQSRLRPFRQVKLPDKLLDCRHH